MTARRWAAALAGMLVVAGASTAFARPLPEWVERAAARPTPPSATNANAVVLVDAIEVRVPATGRIETTRRWAVRILQPRGRDATACAASYERGTSEITDLWFYEIPPNGKPIARGRKEAADMSVAGYGTLHSDTRQLVLDAEEPALGTVVAWEWSSTSDPFLADWRWDFLSPWPSLESSFAIELPEGLEPVAQVFGTSALTPEIRGRRWTWKRTDQPARASEPLASGRWSLWPSLAVSVSGRGAAAGLRFATWTDVARWNTALADPQAQVTPEVSAHARALVAGARDTLARLAAIARDVQALNYVHVALGIGRGWGYRPHAAADVLRSGYGDCKDKANLLCTLLRATGHQAWLLAVNSREREAVEERRPSLAQFDHCIAVMQVPRETRLAATFDHPRLGRLLAFDPTDPLSPFGELPSSEQGGHGLLMAGDNGGLIRLPAPEPEVNLTRRTIDAQLSADGVLTAKLEERIRGTAARENRSLRRELPQAEYRKAIERWLSAGATSVALTSLAAAEDTVLGTFALDAGYVAPGFARLLGNRLLSFRAALVEPRSWPTLPDSARRLPLVLPAVCIAETVTVALPDGFDVDEIPAAVHERTDFATLDADWRAANGRLWFARRWTLRAVTLPPERYGDVRSMFARSLATTQAPVVLVRR